MPIPSLTEAGSARIHFAVIGVCIKYDVTITIAGVKNQDPVSLTDPKCYDALWTENMALISSLKFHWTSAKLTGSSLRVRYADVAVSSAQASVLAEELHSIKIDKVPMNAQGQPCFVLEAMSSAKGSFEAIPNNKTHAEGCYTQTCLP